VHVVSRPADKVSEYAYGTGGRLLAFVEHDLPNARKTKVTYRGHTLDFTRIQEGLPAAAVVLVHAGDGWQLVSVTATTTGWDYAAGWRAAPEARHLGPGSAGVLEAHAATAEPGAATKATLERIAKPADEGDSWAQLASAAPPEAVRSEIEKLPVFVWIVTAELTYTTGRIAWTLPDGSIALLPGLDFTGGELVAITARGRYLLVANSGSGAFPRLYDLVEHKRVYSSDTARSTMFWPR
jgi:hypothetical protein